ncbi:unnamed protein product [Sphagnum troendelagicum]|uniref:F-box domain-containing protein n=1 Tax=Sphagnum troendelagicum TaxID=128251 RepID=A0ABP0TLF0_9BRYO
MGMDICELAASLRSCRSSSVHEKRQRMDQMPLDEIADEELIPGLPNDVALQCLVRIPVQAHAQLQRVSRKWRELVNSSQYYEERKREGTTMHFICTVQALDQQSKIKRRQQQQQQSTTTASNSPSAASSSPPPPPPVLGVSVLNPRERTWEQRLPHILQHPHGLPLFCRLVGVKGKLVVLGGWDPVTWETLRSVYVYHFSSQSWRRGADIPSTRSSFACGVLNDRYVFVAGGHDNRKSALATAEVYDLEKDEWRNLPRMSEERDESIAVNLNGKLYVISGYSTEVQGQFLKSADVYEPEKNSWTRIEDMWSRPSSMQQRQQQQQQAEDHDLSSSSAGRVFTVLSGTLYSLDHNTLFSYSATNNTWSSVATLPSAADHDQLQLGLELNAAGAVCSLTAVKDSLLLLLAAGPSAAAASSSRMSSSSRAQEVADHHQAFKAFVYKPPSPFRLSTAAAAAEELLQEGGSRFSSCTTQWEAIGCKANGFLSVPQFACAVEV